MNRVQGWKLLIFICRIQRTENDDNFKIPDG